MTPPHVLNALTRRALFFNDINDIVFVQSDAMLCLEEGRGGLGDSRVR